MCQQISHSVLKGTVECDAGYDGIICQVVINLFLNAFRVPYVGNRNYADAVCGLHGNHFLHGL